MPVEMVDEEPDPLPTAGTKAAPPKTAQEPPKARKLLGSFAEKHLEFTSSNVGKCPYKCRL
jgi:hypothetical protein